MKLPNLSADIPAFDRVKLTDTLAFTKQLTIMLKSGIALPESIEILSKRTSHKVFRKILLEIHGDIANGQPLYTSLSKFPHAFDSFYVNLIKVSEESGTLEKNLDYLAKHLKKEHEFSGKIKGAMLYPSIILTVALISGIGLSIFVLPQLVDLFASLDVELPITTRILLFIASTISGKGVYIFVGSFLLIILMRFAIATKTIKPYWHALLLSVPIFGPLMQNVQLASMFRNMGTMLEAGMHISTALETQYNSTSNSIYRNYLFKIKTGVEKGKSIDETISNEQKYMPLIAVRMIGVGEKTGKLEETFNYLGDFFEDEVDDASRNLSTAIEPVVLIVVGLIVAFIAVSIISPIYQFTGSV